MLNHDKQEEEAALEVHQFWIPIKVKCSPDFKIVLCILQNSCCLNKLPRCRSPCGRVRKECTPLMPQYGVS